MMIGNTHDETRSLIGRGDPASWTVSWEDLPRKLEQELRVDISGELGRRGIPAAVSTVFGQRRVLRGHHRRPLLARRHRRGRVARAQGSPAYAYQLDWGSPRDGGKWGAFHTLDIPLMFGTLDRARAH